MLVLPCVFVYLIVILTPLTHPFPHNSCFRARYGEGYGLTETAAALSTVNLTDREYGHVGTPLSCCEVKLVDVPDMEYLTSDKPNPRGEVWVRGPGVFKGYYKNAEKTYVFLFFCSCVGLFYLLRFYLLFNPILNLLCS